MSMKEEKREKGRVVSIYLNRNELETINELKTSHNLCFSDGIKEYFKEMGKQGSDSYKMILDNQIKMLDILESLKKFQPIVNVYQEQPKKLLGFWDRFRGK